MNMFAIAEAPVKRNAETPLDKARQTLRLKIMRGQMNPQPYAEIMHIDPAMAKAMLELNPPEENRSLSARRVVTYAQDMEAGRWQGLNGQTIVFSKDGLLNDGQHRLNAVYSIGATIPFTVVFGADRQSRMTLDQNKVRSGGDYLGMSGVRNANNVASVANILYCLENGMLKHGRNSFQAPTKTVLHKYATDRIDAICDAVELVNNTAGRSICAVSRLAAAFVVISQTAGKRAAEEFFIPLMSGENLSRGNPILAARNRLISEKERRQASPANVIEIIIRAWNAHRRGNTMSKVITGGSFPKVAR